MRFKTVIGCIVSTLSLCIFGNAVFAQTLDIGTSDAQQTASSYGADYHNPFTPSENFEQALEDLKNGYKVPFSSLIPEMNNEESLTPFSADNTEFVAAYGYDSLTVKEKKIYNQIVNNMELYMDGETPIVIKNCPKSAISSVFMKAIVSIYYDREDIFWIDTSKLYVSIDGNNLEFGYISQAMSKKEPAKFPNYYSNYYVAGFENATASDISSYLSKTSSIANTAIKSFDLSSRYSAVKSINKWIVERSVYNAKVSGGLKTLYKTNYTPWTILSVFLYNNDGNTENDPVCEGYARSVKYFCDKLSIPCVLVTSEDHMWNYIMMEDGLWYALDTTWNDTTTGSEVYLLVGANTVINSKKFSASHVESINDTPYSFPPLCANKYVFKSNVSHTAVSTTEATTEATTILTDIDGDIDNNGETNKIDIALLLKYITGAMTDNDFYSKYNFPSADSNNDGSVDIIDAISAFEIANQEYTIDNDESYPWCSGSLTVSKGTTSTKVDGYASITNGIPNTDTTLKLNIKKSGNLKFFTFVSSESSGTTLYDYLVIKKNGEISPVNGNNHIGGYFAKYVTIDNVAKGDVIEFTYHKNDNDNNITASVMDYAFVGGFEIS